MTVGKCKFCKKEILYDEWYYYDSEINNIPTTKDMVCSKCRSEKGIPPTRGGMSTKQKKFKTAEEAKKLFSYLKASFLEEE